MPGLNVRAGVKNALNDEVAYLAVRPNGQIDSAVFPRRSIWLQLSWKR